MNSTRNLFKWRLGLDMKNCPGLRFPAVLSGPGETQA